MLSSLFLCSLFFQNEIFLFMFLVIVNIFFCLHTHSLLSTRVHTLYILLLFLFYPPNYQFSFFQSMPFKSTSFFLYQFVYSSLSVFFYLLIYLLNFLFDCLLIGLPSFWSIYLYIYLSIYLIDYLLIYWSLFLSCFYLSIFSLVSLFF